MAGLYLHIPFCKQACHYCDFHFSTDQNSISSVCGAMAKELQLQKVYINEPLKTIYFGGGTPSLLSQRELSSLLDAIHKDYSVASDAEITLEANPDDLSLGKLRELKVSGINRLSIGIQSFDNDILKFLNRAHDSDAAESCLLQARDIGFRNISLDLIYAIPGLTEKRWEETLARALAFSPEHISSYALTIEARTVFGNWNKRGKLHMMEEEPAARQFEMLMNTLENSGYEQYEISNFCKPEFYSQHNSSYWKGASYLGIGPSAHSYNGHSRQFNVRNNAAYVRSIDIGKIPCETEVLTSENKINEYILTSLRTVWGCNLNILKTKLNDDLLQRRGEYLAVVQNRELIFIRGDILTLTRKGKLLADKIAEDLMVEI